MVFGGSLGRLEQLNARKKLIWRVLAHFAIAAHEWEICREPQKNSHFLSDQIEERTNLSDILIMVKSLLSSDAHFMLSLVAGRVHSIYLSPIEFLNSKKHSNCLIVIYSISGVNLYRFYWIKLIFYSNFDSLWRAFAIDFLSMFYVFMWCNWIKIKKWREEKNGSVNHVYLSGGYFYGFNGENGMLLSVYH